MESHNSFWFILFLFFSIVFAQRPETNDQFEPSPEPEINLPTSPKEIPKETPKDLPRETPKNIPKETLSAPSIKETITNAEIKNISAEEISTPTVVVQKQIDVLPKEKSFFEKFCMNIRDLFKRFISTPKVSSVLRNMATCIVNGVMEIVSFYFPAPLIPLLASAAGMIIPFEPVLMLRDRMPVTSYRRAFSTAVNTFLGTFDKYKLEDNYEYDPYMTQRFNRRMMRYGSVEKDKLEVTTGLK